MSATERFITPLSSSITRRPQILSASFRAVAVGVVVGDPHQHAQARADRADDLAGDLAGHLAGDGHRRLQHPLHQATHRPSLPYRMGRGRTSDRTPTQAQPVAPSAPSTEDGLPSLDRRRGRPDRAARSGAAGDRMGQLPDGPVGGPVPPRPIQVRRTSTINCRSTSPRTPSTGPGSNSRGTWSLATRRAWRWPAGSAWAPTVG